MKWEDKDYCLLSCGAVQYDLFSGIAKNRDYIISNGMVNNELGRVRKETMMV